MVDQAEALRRLVLQRSAHETSSDRRGGLFVVVSARPEAGATTVARQVALQLYRQTWNVGLVEVTHDRHYSGSGDRPVVEPMWDEVALGRRTLREAWRPGPCGLPTVCSRNDGPMGAPEKQKASDRDEDHSDENWGAEQLKLAARGQWIVVDAGDSQTAGPYLKIADECCLVVDAEAAHTMEQYAEIKRLAGHLRGARCWLLINRSHDGTDAGAIQQRLIATAERFLNLALLPLGVLPEDGPPDAMDDGRTHAPEGGMPSEWRLALRRVVQRWEDAQASPWKASVRC